MDLLVAESVAPSGMCAVRGGLGYVVLCNLLSGSECRLRATRKVGEVTGGSNLLAMSGVSLAQACRTGTWTGGALGQASREVDTSSLRFSDNAKRHGPRPMRARKLCRDLSPLGEQFVR
jgi:hypothetical protein